MNSFKINTLQRLIWAISLTILFCLDSLSALAQSNSILNVSYDPTREFYQDYNKIFKTYWKKEKGIDIEIRQSHGGSGKQARAVIDGLEADVVTLALAFDIDEISLKSSAISKDWQKRLPHNSSPYTSTIIFLVRKGNPKNIKDWSDLINPGVEVITPNPKTSGGARWNYLAAYGYALKTYGNDESKAKEFISKFFKNVPVLDTGARGATTTFAQRQIGDVLVTWENEAFLALEEFPDDGYEIITPSISILAEPPIAIVDKNVDKRQSREISEAYLKYLYSDEGQRLAAKHHFRPTNEAIAVEYKSTFTTVELFTIDQIFGGWSNSHKTHFQDGAVFDQIYSIK